MMWKNHVVLEIEKVGTVQFNCQFKQESSLLGRRLISIEDPLSTWIRLYICLKTVFLCDTWVKLTVYIKNNVFINFLSYTFPIVCVFFLNSQELSFNQHDLFKPHQHSNEDPFVTSIPIPQLAIFSTWGHVRQNVTSAIKRTTGTIFSLLVGKRLERGDKSRQTHLSRTIAGIHFQTTWSPSLQ